MKLVKFLQKLNREQVTIECKNGTVIQGTVVGVDSTMNCHLKKARHTEQFNFSSFSLFYPISRGKNPVSHATLSVRGSTIRSWILPEALNLDSMLVDDTPKKSAAAAAAAKGPRAAAAVWDGEEDADGEEVAECGDRI
eukprot:CAMPEP_0168820940 /NCGR_PEP_ID=MMETSP0726-20121227/9129_1 /TAXON_ID=265536 /ORGANISM="Amphiprora sp., Strain CCMP467" /LENGTH=137 /DNA_ID=CAMNT_0008873509 /DNA_START=166 /DNA_END=580 /DNA_ORIENTATION=+